MRITRIDIEGRPGHYATVSRVEDLIVVELLTPELPNGRTHHVDPDCDDDLWSMAECLQFQLDGYRGTNTEIHLYHCELQRLAN